MPNNSAPENYLTTFDESNSAISLHSKRSEIFGRDLAPRAYQVPEGYDGSEAPFHTYNDSNGLPVFDIAIGFRSGSLYDVNSPYGKGFYSKISGSGLVNSDPGYKGQYLVTASRIYNYFASVLNDHEDFIFSNTKVDAVAIISFRNRVMRKGLDLGSYRLKHYCSVGADFKSSDHWSDSNYLTQSKKVGPYSMLIQKGKNDYDATVLDNRDTMNDRKVGKIYQNQGIVLLDLVKLYIRNSNGDWEKANQVNDWRRWHDNWPVAAIVSSSYSWSLDRTKDILQRMRILNNETYMNRTYFCRAGLNDFNWTTNPTFMTSSSPQSPGIPIHNPTFTYITSVGLYSDNNELMALGKLNKPIRKDQNSMINITAKINY